MKRTILTLMMILAACGLAFGQNYTKTSNNAEQEIRKMFELTAQALLKNDTAALSNYYADDLTFTIADGRTINKSQFLEFAKNSKREAFNFSDLQIRSFGDTAVVNFNRTSTNVSPDGTKVSSKSRDTATLVKNGKGWQFVALQISNEMAGNQADGNAEQEIRQTLDKLADALTRRDADAAANYWADNWTFIGRNGEMANKTQRLAGMKTGQPRPGAFKYEDLNIRVLGPNTAVVLARPTYPIKFDNGNIVTVNDRATMTLVKTDGRWQIVATQTTWDNPDTGDTAAVEKQISEILTNWGNAIARRDIAAIEKILPPNQLMVFSPDGKILSREQYLEAMKALPGKATVSGKSDKISVQGETAISMGSYTVTPEGGQPVNYNYTATFVRRAGRWFPAAFYSAAQK